MGKRTSTIVTNSVDYIQKFLSQNVCYKIFDMFKELNSDMVIFIDHNNDDVQIVLDDDQKILIDVLYVSIRKEIDDTVENLKKLEEVKKKEDEEFENKKCEVSFNDIMKIFNDVYGEWHVERNDKYLWFKNQLKMLFNGIRAGGNGGNKIIHD